ncbi:unnamed protein product [Rotaria sp. Silwood1]|nr:unnamed protein product [Rotaria sp. Silwood1]
MGYFSYDGCQAIRDFLYNAPLVNFIVSSLITFTIVAITNIIIIVYMLKAPQKTIASVDLHHHDTLLLKDVQPSEPSDSSFNNMPIQITKKDVNYETTIILTTNCLFLITNSIAIIYIYVKSSHRLRLTKDLKTFNVYRLLRMLTLFGIVLEFYIYFLTGKKFHKEVYRILRAILKHTPLRNYCKCTCLSSSDRTTNISN